VTPEGNVTGGMRTLLTYIVARYVADDERRSIERSAGAQVQGDELEADKEAVFEREQALAEDQIDAFSRGLTLAIERHRGGQAMVSLDDRDPSQNAMASALIGYLVRFDLATSSVREVGGQHYIYDISVDWERLEDLATDNGQRLDDLFEISNGVA
jgi:hypothetical protein